MTDTHEFAIYFEDLTEKAQRSLLIYAGIPDPRLYELGRVPRGNYQP